MDNIIDIIVMIKHKDGDKMRKFFFVAKSAIYIFFTMFLRPKFERIKKKSREESEKFIYNHAKKWARFTMKASKLKVKVIGKENLLNETCLYVANHQSIVDIPLVIDCIDRPLGAVGKKELENVPLVSYWAKNIRCVFLDRDNPREGLKAILEATENLKDGHSMLIFPEGTRSRDGKLNEFKKGSLKLATRANVPIVPITIDGTYKVLEGSKKAKKSDLDCKIVIHKPIYPKELSKEDQSNLAQICKDIVEGGFNM